MTQTCCSRLFRGQAPGVELSSDMPGTMHAVNLRTQTSSTSSRHRIPWNKRTLFDSNSYSAPSPSNVGLVAESIQSISENGSEIEERLRQTDVIICAIGFEASEFLVPMSV